MIRALTTLVGLAGAAAILYFVTDVGGSGGSLWPIALVWASAGLAIGVLYQSGGRRAPGLRRNVPLLILAFAPWTVLTAALVAIGANNPVWLADRGRNIVPHAWIDRWEVSLPAFALVSGLLLAFSLIEPRIGMREPPPVDSAHAPIEPYTPYSPPEPAYADGEPEPRSTPITAIQPSAGDAPQTVVTDVPDTAETVVEPEQRAIDERPTRLLSDGGPGEPENPVQVIRPGRDAPRDG